MSGWWHPLQLTLVTAAWFVVIASMAVVAVYALTTLKTRRRVDHHQ